MGEVKGHTWGFLRAVRGPDGGRREWEVPGCGFVVNDATQTVVGRFPKFEDAVLHAGAPEMLAEGLANAAFLDHLAAHLEAEGMAGQAGNCTIRAKATRAAIQKATGGAK